MRLVSLPKLEIQYPKMKLEEKSVITHSQAIPSAFSFWICGIVLIPKLQTKANALFLKTPLIYDIYSRSLPFHSILDLNFHLSLSISPVPTATIFSTLLNQSW